MSFWSIERLWKGMKIKCGDSVYLLLNQNIIICFVFFTLHFKSLGSVRFFYGFEKSVLFSQGCIYLMNRK